MSNNGPCIAPSWQSYLCNGCYEILCLVLSLNRSSRAFWFWMWSVTRTMCVEGRNGWSGGRIKENGGWISWTLTQKLESRKENLLLERLFKNVNVEKTSEAITEPVKTQHCKHKIFQIHVFYVICKCCKAAIVWYHSSCYDRYLCSNLNVKNATCWCQGVSSYLRSDEGKSTEIS